jgi:hypothetical protein
MYFHGGVATDSARFVRSAWLARRFGAWAQRFFVGDPMPMLQAPAPSARHVGSDHTCPS